MIKQISFIFILYFIVFQTSAQNTIIGDNIFIDSNVQNVVSQHLSPLSGKVSDTLGLIYYSHIIWDSYHNDSLISSTTKNDSLANGPFKAFYFFKDDSLYIIGEFGLVSGFRFGFVAKNKNKDLITQHFFCDEIPSFKLNLDDSLQYCIVVTCPLAKIYLSKLPNLNNTDPIFGYVDFTTGKFYEKTSKGVIKTKSKMKIYFLARYTDVKE